jgi:hypothetical protein
VTWFRPDGFGFHAGGWLAYALVILVLFALCVALLRILFRVFRRERDTEKNESDYWRIHGG